MTINQRRHAFRVGGVGHHSGTQGPPGSPALLPLLVLPPPHLQTQPDALGDGRLGEGGLHLGHQLAGQRAALGADQVALLLDARHHGEVEREVRGDDATDALLGQLLLALQLWGGGGWEGQQVSAIVVFELGGHLSL